MTADKLTKPAKQLAARRRFMRNGVLSLAGTVLPPLLPELLPRSAVARQSAVFAAESAPAAKPGAKFIWRNWSGIEQAQAQLATPGNQAELAALLKNAGGVIRPVGASHSFSPLVPTSDTIVSLDRMSGILQHDKDAQTVTVAAGTRLALLSRELDKLGLAMRNLPDVDVQSIAGALSTATHGTGADLPALHADIVRLQLITAKGETLECSAERNPEIFAAARVSLGALGIVSEVTLRVVPAYNLRRRVWLMPLEEMLQSAPKLAKEHRHFEFYYLPHTGYAAAITHVVDTSGTVVMPPSEDENMLRDLRRLRDWAGKFPSLRRWLAGKLIDPKLTESAQNRSFKLLSNPRPTKFNESECHVPREHGIACLRDVIRNLEQRNDVYFPLEFRFVKADDAWLSPFFQRDSCSIAAHSAHGEAYDYLVNDLGPIFRKYQGRPHWGKLHRYSKDELASLYPRWHDFLAVRQTLDPQRRFLNPHLQALFGIKS